MPQKINTSLTEKIDEIKKELNDAEKLKIDAKKVLSDYEIKIDKSKKETKEIINLAKKSSEDMILDKTKKFHQLIENKKRNTEYKINQMKENALKEIKIATIKISIDVVENLIQNSIDKSKIEKLYSKSLEQAQTTLKKLSPRVWTTK